MTETVLPMYHLKTVQDPSSIFYYNTAMYGMKNLVDSTLSTKTGSNNSTDVMYSELEQTQAVIFEYIAAIKKQIQEIRQILLKRSGKQLNVSPESILKSEMCSEVSKSGVTHEVVINANVNKPPYSLLVLKHLTEQSLSFKVTTHLHSSLVGLTEKLERFRSINGDETNGGQILDIRLIWKNEGNTSVTFGYVPLDGEVSLLRFIHSCLKLNLNPSEETKLQELLDQLHNSGPNSFDSVVKGTDYLLSNKLTVLDIGLWSALKSTPPCDKLQKWFKRLDEILSK